MASIAMQMQRSTGMHASPVHMGRTVGGHRSSPRAALGRQVSFSASNIALQRSSGPAKRTLHQNDLKIAQDRHRPGLRRQGSSLAEQQFEKLTRSVQPARRSLDKVAAAAMARAPSPSAAATNGAAKRRTDFATEVAAMKVHLRKDGGWVLDPNSPFMRKWDLVTMMALLFTATITPYEVAVLTTAINFLFVVNRLIDAIFVVDMVMQFFLMFREDLESGGGWVRDRRRIRNHYLKGWFTIDLISILPFDIVAFVLQDGALGKMKALRIIRLLRLLKLVRIVRASRIFKRWETSISVSYSVLSLVKFLVMIVIFGHWLACAWALLHDSSCDRDCTAAVAVGNESVGDTWLVAWIRAHGTPGVVPAPNEIYTLAMYWSIMTLTSIGYGDIAAQTQLEYGFATLFMLVGAIIWAYIIGSTCGIVATLDVETMQFRQTMDQLNRFMHDEMVPDELRRELRGYFHQARTLQAARASKTLLDSMSPMLKGRVADHIVGSIVKAVPYFVGAEPEFLVEIAQHFKNMVFAPNEVLDEGDLLYHLLRGIVALGGRVLSRGAVWGEDMILSCAEYQETAAAMSLTYVEVVTLSKLDLEEVVSWFPATAAVLRKSLVHMTVSRGLIIEARKIKRAQGVQPEPGTPHGPAPGIGALQQLRKRKSSSRRMSAVQAREIKELVREAQIEAEAGDGAEPGLAGADASGSDSSASEGGAQQQQQPPRQQQQQPQRPPRRANAKSSRSGSSRGGSFSSGADDAALATSGMSVRAIEEVVRRCMKEVLAQQFVSQQYQMQQAQRRETAEAADEAAAGGGSHSGGGGGDGRDGSSGRRRTSSRSSGGAAAAVAVPATAGDGPSDARVASAAASLFAAVVPGSLRAAQPPPAPTANSAAAAGGGGGGDAEVLSAGGDAAEEGARPQAQL